MNKIRDWYSKLQLREQRMVLVGAIVVAALLLFGGVLLPLQAAAARAERRADTRREDLEWMHLHADEVRDGAAQLHPDTGEAPVVLVNRVGTESGLGTAFRGTQPSGVTGVRVQLEAAPFDPMIQWLDTLEQRYGLSIESITVDRTGKAGIVNASVTLNQTKH
jgi:general secretion pathway protein M